MRGKSQCHPYPVASTGQALASPVEGEEFELKDIFIIRVWCNAPWGITKKKDLLSSRSAAKNLGWGMSLYGFTTPPPDSSSSLNQVQGKLFQRFERKDSSRMTKEGCFLSKIKESTIGTSNCFRIIHTCPDTGARAGELITSHGVVPTPVFMPVGSQATVKSLTPDELKDIGVKMLLANTYHLYLRPGIDIVRKLGGLHRFMSWDRTILTDSGGFQVFSLARLREVNDEGVVFRSHIDGSQHLITPERCIQLQEALGADVIMVLDQCPSAQDDLEKVRQAMARTHKWAERCFKAHASEDQLLFGIVQGGFSAELRHESAGFLTSLDFPGYAIGGLSLGEPKELTLSMIETTVQLLPKDKPRYLMGVGSPEDLLNGVARGIDMFDCVLPTRVARNGGFFTSQGRHNIRNSLWKELETPIDTDCSCYTCRNFSAAYLHHLFRCEELLAYRLMTIHNLSFMHNFMNKIRHAIISGTFVSFRDSFLAGYKTTDEQLRISQKQKWLDTRNQSARGG